MSQPINPIPFAAPPINRSRSHAITIRVSDIISRECIVMTYSTTRITVDFVWRLVYLFTTKNQKITVALDPVCADPHPEDCQPNELRNSR
jgi:hypothetical protein